MGPTIAIPAHLAVHVLGAAVCAALAFDAGRRGGRPVGWVWTFAGAALLAVSHLVVGGLFVEDLGWPMLLRVAGYVGLAVGGAGGLRRGPPGLGVVVLPTMLPVAPQVSHGIAALTGAAAAIAWLRGAVIGGGSLFAAGLALWAVGDLVLLAGAIPASVLSVLGSIAVGVWLLRRAQVSLLARVAASYVGVLLLVVIGLAALGGALLGADLERDALEGLRVSADARAAEVGTEWPEEMLTVSRLFGQEALAEALGQGDPERLERLARGVAELPDVDVVLLLAADGGVAASYGWTVQPEGPLPGSEALGIAADDVVAPALEGASSSGIVALGARDALAIGATPVHAVEEGDERRDQLVGVLVAGRRLADPIFLQRVATGADADVTAVVGGEVAASTLTAVEASEVATAVVGGAGGGTVAVDGQPVFVAAGELDRVESAWLVLSRDATAIAASEQRFTRMLFLIAFAGIGLALPIGGWSARRTTGPILRLQAAAERVARGDLEVESGVDQPDEVGQLAESFDQMTASLRARQRELVQAAEIQARLRERFEVLTTSMEEGLVAVEPDGTVQTLNPAAMELLGASADDVVGASVGDVIVGHDETGSDLVSALGPADAADVRAARGWLRRGEQDIDVSATAAPLRSEGERIGRVYVLRDVTAEMEAERMKTEFLANVSHELRTPLTPIRGYAEVLRRREVPLEKVRGFAENITEATDRLERIIGMLVDFSALEAGRVEVRLEPTSLGDIVDEVLEHRRARHPDRRLSRYVARDVPPVLVDGTLLARVLEELTDNALKFSDGPVRVRARREDRRVRLAIVDDGVGIDTAEMAAITDAFRQVDGGATRRYGGLGLGLSLVMRIIERIGADLEIRSAVGEGTEIDLLLPVAERGRRDATG